MSWLEKGPHDPDKLLNEKDFSMITGISIIESENQAFENRAVIRGSREGEPL
jgi:hypothetical protein